MISELNACIVSDEIAAQTRECHEKIPVDIVLEYGTVVHPSVYDYDSRGRLLLHCDRGCSKQPWVKVPAKKPSDSCGFLSRAAEVPIQCALLTKGLLDLPRSATSSWSGAPHTSTLPSALASMYADAG